MLRHSAAFSFLELDPAICAEAARSLCLYTRNALCSGCRALFLLVSIRSVFRTFSALLTGLPAGVPKIKQLRSPAGHPTFCQTVVLSVSFRISGICLHLRTSFIETKKLRRSPPAVCRVIPEAILLNRSRTYEINILSILKIRKQSQHPIFSPNPSASDQISPPKKKKRHGKRRSENAVLPSGLFPM